MLALLISVLSIAAPAQTCLTTSDMDEATRSALVATGKRFYDLAANGDAASLQQSATYLRNFLPAMGNQA